MAASVHVWSSVAPKLQHRSSAALLAFWVTVLFVCSRWTFLETYPTPEAISIPKKIWQIWIHPTQQSSREWHELSYTWTDMNPGWDYTYAAMDFPTAEVFVQKAFQHRPDVADAFLHVNETIHRADLLRYLLLLEEGGVYSDLDTRCAKPIQDWIPPRYKDSTGLVVGIEINDYIEGHYDPDRPYVQLCQWSIMARPHHPTLEKVVSSVTRRLLGWDTEDVMEITGPGVSCWLEPHK
jgi:mannosyltransferase OCH1-like enzyme